MPCPHHASPVSRAPHHPAEVRRGGHAVGMLSPRAVMPRPPSSSGLGHRPFTPATRVRIPLGVRITVRRRRAHREAPECEAAHSRFGREPPDVPVELSMSKRAVSVETTQGPVAQLVRVPPCHGGGRRFKPGQGRPREKAPEHRSGVFRIPCSLRIAPGARHPRASCPARPSRTTDRSAQRSRSGGLPGSPLPPPTLGG